MTCNDQKDACCGDCQECDDYKPLSTDTDISRSIDFAVAILTDLDNEIPEEADYDNIVVTVNAARLAGICESLLDYACVDGVDVEELFAMNDLVQHHTSSNKQTSKTIH